VVLVSGTVFCLVYGFSNAAAHQGLTGLALAHGYDTAFWWTAGIFAAGAVVGGVLLRRGPLVQKGTASQAPGGVPTAQAAADHARPA
jgi:hypothetical protein